MQLIHSSRWMANVKRKRPSEETPSYSNEFCKRIRPDNSPRSSLPSGGYTHFPGAPGACTIPVLRRFVRQGKNIVPSQEEVRFSPQEVSVSYHHPQALGCSHYERKVKLRAPCCGKLFVCRFCHDQVDNDFYIFFNFYILLNLFLSC